jgi:ribosome-associated toxin RatA of RatAB toxin-antitoxin module
MKEVVRSVLVPYADGEMFALVADVAAYPAFLPWCAGTRVLAQEGATTTARIDIDYHGVRAHFTTANAHHPPGSIVITLKDGPFRRLNGDWRFRALAADASKVELTLAYEFANGVLEAVIGPAFNHIAHTFVDAFVERATMVYGPR